MHVAHVDLALLQEDSEQQEAANVSSFTSLKVSEDLDVLVIVSSSNTAVAVNLNLYFRYADDSNFSFAVNRPTKGLK